MKTLFLLLVLPALTIAQSIDLVRENEGDNNVKNRSFVDEDSSVEIYHSGPKNHHYKLDLELSNKSNFNLKNQTGNPIVIKEIDPKDIIAIRITDENTGDIEQLSDLEGRIKSLKKIVPDYNPFLRRANCGTGTIPYTNCDLEFIQVPRENIAPSTFVHVDDDYITCIAYIDENCNIEESFRTFCTYYPGESAGDYDLGYIHYDKVIGIEDYTNETGIQCSDRQGEEIHFVLCNAEELGYSTVQMNKAIWGILNQQPCNGLCNKARNSVDEPSGKISPHLEFYVPRNGNNVQPQVRNACYQPDIDPLYYPCGSNRQIDTYVKGIMKKANNEKYIDIPNPENVIKVMAEFWVEPRDCFGGATPNTIKMIAHDGATQITEYALYNKTIQTSTSNTIERVYRHLFEGSFDRIAIDPAFNECDAASMALYVVRKVVGSSGSLGAAVNREFHRSEYEFSLSIGSSPDIRDIVLNVPIHEISNNGRIARIEAWYDGGTVVVNEVTMATEGLQGALLELIVPNVPADKEVINIKIISPNVNGESFGVGSVAITTRETCCVESHTEIDASICESDHYTLPDGNTVTETGTYITTLQAVDECDSIIEIHLETIPEYNLDFVYEICDGESVLLPDGSQVQTSGSHTFQLTSSRGCDSTINVEVIVHDVIDEVINVNLCDGEQYELPDGQFVNTTGTYIQTATNQHGCDYLITTNVTVYPNFFVSESISICESLDYQLPDGSTVSNPGTYTSQMTTINGCDSIIETTLIHQQEYNLDYFYEVCEGESVLLPDGSTTTVSGNHSFQFTTASGCDSIINVEVVVHEVDDVVLSVSLCEGEDYEMPDGSVVNVSGTYTQTSTNDHGCDYTVSVVLTVHPIHFFNETVSICENEVHQLPDGSIASAPGTYISNLSTIQGCDSIIETTVIQQAEYNLDYLYEVCEGESVALPDGTSTITSGSHSFLFTTTHGCDSIIHVEVIVHEVNDTIINVDLCDGEQYELVDGQFVDASGTYVQTVTNQYGCNYSVTTNVTFHPNYTMSETIALCASEEHELPDGSIVTSEGIYTSNLLTVHGCDSIIETRLMKMPEHNLDLYYEVCEGESVPLPDGSSATASGDHSYAFVSSQGCDSIINVSVLVHPKNDIDQLAHICLGESYELPDGSFINQEGVYKDTMIDQNGCEQIWTTNLFVHQPDTVIQNIVICEGEEHLLPDGQAVKETGIYLTTLNNVQGCDSLVIVELEVLPHYEFSFYQQICEGESYELPNGNMVDEEGEYMVPFVTQFGCDSILNYQISFFKNGDTTIVATICEGEQYLLPDGNFVHEQGTYEVAISDGSCNAAVTIQLIVNPQFEESHTIELCEGESYMLPDGRTVDSSGTFISNLETYQGCDSVITTILIFNPIYLNEVEVFICPNDTFILPNGVHVSETDVIDVINTTVDGCDSITQYKITQLTEDAQHEEVAICEGDDYQLTNGEWVSEEGIYAYTLQSEYGCSIEMVTEVVVLNNYLDSLTYSICEGEDFVLPSGLSVSEEGIYTEALTTVKGCDSLIVIELDVLPVTTESEVVLCEGDSYVTSTGLELSEAGIYRDTFMNELNCPIVRTTEVVVQQTTYVQTAISICQGEVYETSNGQTMTSNGTYIDTLVSVSGCDSIVTINLKIELPKYTHVELELCAGDFHVLPSGEVTFEAGTYLDTLNSIFGCDSIITTKLMLRDAQRREVRQKVCPGDYYELPNGQRLTQDTVLEMKYETNTVCDSTVLYVVNFRETPFTLFDTLMCADFPLIIGEGIYWEDGIYTDTFTNVNGCDSLVSLRIALRDNFEAHLDTIICPTQQLVFYGRDISEKGSYVFNFIDQYGCDSVYHVTVNHFESPEIVAREDTTIRKGSVVKAYVRYESDDRLHYKWSINDEPIHEGVKSFSQEYFDEARVSVKVEDEHQCYAQDEFRIKLETNCPESLITAANIISPNGDGANDYFEIKTAHELRVELVEIYNRWGEVVFRSNDLSNRWDGTFRGETCNPDVYTYYTRAYCRPGEGFTKYGNITLIK